MTYPTNTSGAPRGIMAVRAQGGDPTAVLAEVTAAFNEFKDKHNAQVAELAQTVEEQNKAIARLTVGGPGGPRTDDEKSIKAALDFIAATTGQRPKPEEIDHGMIGDYADAFGKYLRRGDAVTPEVKAAMSVGSDPDGGYYVEPTRSNEIVTRLFDTSPMRQIARVETITGDAWEQPYSADEATSGGWVAETGSRAETATPTVGMLRIPVHEHYASPKITQKLLDDANFDVGGWLEDKIIAKFAREENQAFVSGNGVGKPKGFLAYKDDAVTTADATRAWGVLQYIATGASAGFPTVSGSSSDDASSLIDTVTALKPAYRMNANWVMNRSTVGAVRKLRDNDGRWLWQDSMILGQPARLLGFPVVELEDMPDIAGDSFSIAFGDFRSGYLIIDRLGFRVLRDPFTAKPYVIFYSTKRTGGDVRDSDAIKLVKFAAS